MGDAVSPNSDSVNRPPIMAFVKSESDLDSIKAFAKNHDWPDTHLLQGDITDAIAFLGSNPVSDLLFVEIPGAEQAPDLLSKLAEVCDPDVKVIVVGEVNEYSFFCWLTDLGIAHYLLKPIKEEAIETAWQKITSPVAGTTDEKNEPGKIVGVVGARGGCGATTLGIYLAAIAAKRAKKHCSIIDLDPQDGSVSLLLDIEPSHGFREALEKPDRIDMLFLERVMNRVTENLYILSSEESLNEKVIYHDQAAMNLLGELKHKSSIIVLDLPRLMNAFTRNCLLQCDQICIVAEPTLASLRDTLRLRDYFKDNLKLPAPHIILNKEGLAPKHEMTVADFEKGLGDKLMYHVPFAPDLFFDMNADLPAMQSMNTPAMKTLLELVESLLPDMVAETEEEIVKNGSPGMLGWLKKGKE